MKALEYHVIVEPLSAGDGGGYLASVPDLPGCMSDGETPEEALGQTFAMQSTPGRRALGRWTAKSRNLPSARGGRIGK